MDLKDTYESVKQQWGLDPKPDNPNPYQSILIAETEAGENKSRGFKSIHSTNGRWDKKLSRS